MEEIKNRQIDLVNDILKEELPIFDFSNPPTDPIELAKVLVENMIEKKGVGLAANQLGLPYRAFVIHTKPFVVMFNAKIVSHSDKEVMMPEGCLSFPGLKVKIKRPESIKVRFTLPNGEIKTENFSGLTARIVQHELDHVNGILFFDRATRFHLDQAKRQAARKNK